MTNSFINTNVSAEQYMQYFDAITTVEFVAKNGLDNVKVDTDRLAPSNHSIKQSFSHLFDPIKALFSKEYREIRQRERNEKLVVLFEQIKIINKMHKTCEKVQNNLRSLKKDDVYKERMARLYAESTPAIDKVNKMLRRQSKDNWSNRHFGSQIHLPTAAFITNFTNVNITVVDSMSKDIKKMRQEIWKGNATTHNKAFKVFENMNKDNSLNYNIDLFETFSLYTTFLSPQDRSIPVFKALKQPLVDLDQDQLGRTPQFQELISEHAKRMQRI